jgi:hypothetical protein
MDTASTDFLVVMVVALFAAIVGVVIGWQSAAAALTGDGDDA